MTDLAKRIELADQLSRCGMGAQNKALTALRVMCSSRRDIEGVYDLVCFLFLSALYPPFFWLYSEGGIICKFLKIRN